MSQWCLLINFRLVTTMLVSLRQIINYIVGGVIIEGSWGIIVRLIQVSLWLLI